MDFLNHLMTNQPIGPEDFREYVIRSVDVVMKRMAIAPFALSEEETIRALAVLDYALSLAEAWPATHRLLMRLAPKMELTAYRNEWLRCLQRGIECSRRMQDLQGEADLYWYWGHLARQQSRYEEANRHLQASLAAYATLAHAQGQGRAHNELAFVACLQRHYDVAQYHVKQAQQWLVADDPEWVLSYRILGMIANDQERWEEAEAYHRQAIQLCERQGGDQRLLAWCLQNLGYVLSGQNRLAEAVVYLERASAILTTLQDHYHWAIVQMNLGRCYRYGLRPADSVVCHQQAEVIFRRASDLLNLAGIWTNLGLDYYTLAEWEAAEKSFSYSAMLYGELGDEGWRLNAVDGLGMTYLASQMYAKAVAVLEPAVAALPQISHLPNYSYLLHSLSKHLEDAQKGLTAG
jgi:tetratricopeptide (TPR) repeat protein